MDSLDLKLLRLLCDAPRVGMREYARILQIARGTVHARIERMERMGVVRSYAANVAPEHLGYNVQAFTHIHLAQGKLDSVISQLKTVPQVVAAYTTTGDGDVVCILVARDNRDLEGLIQQLLSIQGVLRTRTDIALNERIQHRVLPLIDVELARMEEAAKKRTPASPQISAERRRSSYSPRAAI
jgi:DNA-binding Lrp family transcriptional regulator